MARSMRSKRGRKLRAVKRIRYGEKELLRLKNMLAEAAKEEKKTPLQNNDEHCKLLFVNYFPNFIKSASRTSYRSPSSADDLSILRLVRSVFRFVKLV